MQPRNLDRSNSETRFPEYQVPTVIGARLFVDHTVFGCDRVDATERGNELTDELERWLSCKPIFRMLITLTYEYLVFMLSLSLSHENEWYRVRLISFRMTIELLTLFLGFPCTQSQLRICFWNCLCSVGLPKTRDHHFLAYLVIQLWHHFKRHRPLAMGTVATGTAAG